MLRKSVKRIGVGLFISEGSAPFCDTAAGSIVYMALQVKLPPQLASVTAVSTAILGSRQAVKSCYRALFRATRQCSNKLYLAGSHFRLPECLPPISHCGQQPAYKEHANNEIADRSEIVVEMANQIPEPTAESQLAHQ